MGLGIPGCSFFGIACRFCIIQYHEVKMDSDPLLAIDSDSMKLVRHSAGLSTLKNAILVQDSTALLDRTHPSPLENAIFGQELQPLIAHIALQCRRDTAALLLARGPWPSDGTPT